MIAASKSTTCFVYGTLMSPDVLRALLGRVPKMTPKACLRHHSRHPVRGRVYPGVIPNVPKKGSSVAPANAAAVEGVLLEGITPLEQRYLDYFEDEGVDYIRSVVQVRILIPTSNNDEDQDGTNNKEGNMAEERIVQTNAYIWALGATTLDTSRDWDYDRFLADHLDWYLESVQTCRNMLDREIS